METALVIVRLLQFTAAMTLFGSAALALALAQHYPHGSALRREFDRALRSGLWAAAIVAIGSALLWLDLEAGIMGDGWDQTLVPGTVSLVLLDTRFGYAWCCHLVLGGALVAILLLSSPNFIFAALAGAFLASLAWAGHAVMHPGGGHLVVQVVHLLAAGLWVGSLPALLYLAARAWRDPTQEWRGALRHMLPLYSQVGYFTVALIVLTGIVNSIFLVGSLHKLVTTVYGRVLLVKIALVLLMLGVAAANRWLLWPRIDAERAGGAASAGAVRAFSHAVAIELAAGVLVLLAVSLLGILPPAAMATVAH